METLLNCVLLIDDDEATNYINQLIIARVGVKEVVATENGREALLFLHDYQQEGQVDLILLDLNMPIMNGWEFLDAYHKLPTRGNTKIFILLSTDLEPAQKELLIAYPSVNGFIDKPISKTSFSQLLNDLSLVQ